MNLPKHSILLFLAFWALQNRLLGATQSNPVSPTLDTLSVVQTPGGTIYRLRKSWKEIPIANLQAVAFHHSQGVSLIAGKEWHMDMNLPSQYPDYDPLKLQVQLVDYLRSSGFSVAICQVNPVWWWRNDSLLPALRYVTCPGSSSGNREVVQDVLQGEIISNESRLAYAGQDTTVRALVFNPDPLTKAGVNYGAPYVDSNDGDVPELNAQRDTVSIRINLVQDTFYLKGAYIELRDIEMPYDLPVRQDHPDFFFPRSAQGFEDVTVYYHIQRWQEYIRSLGYTQLCDFPFWVDPHGMNGADNSYFSPGSNRFDGYLSFGEGGVDDGEDADVIVHEYGHALSYDAAPGTNFGTERRGLDEGICDYFAAAASKDLNGFRWNELYTWDGHNEFWAGRLADQNLIYPITGTNIYTFGSLWVTVMMEIRQALGSNVADRLQLQALYLNVSNNSLPQAARNIILSDTALFGGVHTPVLLQNFCGRHILSGAECNGIASDSVLDGKMQELYPNPSTGVFNLPGNELPWEIWDVYGRMLEKGTGEKIVLQNQPPGLYWLRLGGSTRALMLQ